MISLHVLMLCCFVRDSLQRDINHDELQIGVLLVFSRIEDMTCKSAALDTPKSQEHLFHPCFQFQNNFMMLQGHF